MKKIILLVLATAIIAASIMLIIKFVTVGEIPLGKDTTLSALPVFYANRTVESVDASKSAFLESYDKIIEAAKNLNVTVFLNQQTCIKNENKTLLSQYMGVEKRKWKNDNAWVGNGSAENFVFKIPVVSKTDNWKYENGKVIVSYIACKDSLEMTAIEESTGKATSCSSGEEEKWRENGNIVFLMDENGIVYFAGGYCGYGAFG